MKCPTSTSDTLNYKTNKDWILKLIKCLLITEQLYAFQLVLFRK
jgi:hypothetical protein